MLHGEKRITPAPTTSGSTAREMPEAPAPMITCTPSAMCFSTVRFATAGLVPSSPSSHTTGSPSTPPAALISLIARAAAAPIGG